MLDFACDIPDADIFTMEHNPSHYKVSHLMNLNKNVVSYFIDNALVSIVFIFVLDFKNYNFDF